MAHELAKSDATGKYRMCFRKRSEADHPWHQDSTHCHAWLTDPDIQTVIKDLEANIEIITRPIFDQDGQVIEEARETWRPSFDAQGQPITNESGVKLGRRLGIVGPQYTIIQDHEVINWFSPWVDSGAATIETGGAIFGGSKFWVLAKINKDPLEVVPGDAINQYVLAFNGHDGKSSFKAFPTDVRVVCNNTVNVALKSPLAKRYQAKHSRLIHLKAQEIRDDISVMQKMFVETVDKFKALAGKNVKDEDTLKLYFQKVLKEKEDPDKEIREDGKRPLHVLMRLFDEPEQTLPGMKGTYWSAFNCLTNFLSHLRGRSSDIRLDNMISGSSIEMCNRAIDLAMAA